MSQRNKSNDFLDEVFSELDKNLTSNESQEELLKRVLSYNSGNSINYRTNYNSRVVKRPSLPTVNQIGEFSGRYDCFQKLLMNVDYGPNNSSEYVEGHAEALNKYMAQAQAASKDLSVVEARVNEEITKYNHINRERIFVKGYYDGLIYVYRALKKSKELIVTKIQNELRKGLNL
ncbi:MAG: hypothetical protein IJJ30_01660 [Erysipelotrichaceae bacterium]|nr:hypothetical protein [Erysipelotrichaceae bacterium]MBR2551804.1 hypothetical protein [Erysipelotrichaceae bacterium]